MSAVGNEIAIDNPETFRFDTEATTRVSVNLCRGRWTIENVSQLFDEEEIKGPDLLLTSTCKCYISFAKKQNWLLIQLYNISETAIRIEIHLVVLDCEGTKLYEMKKIRKNFENFEYDVLMNDPLEKIGQQLNLLKDDKLIIECSLKERGRDRTKFCSFQSETECLKNLLKDLKMMFNDPVGSDFTFEVGDDLIYAHKTILSFRSTYFKRMFEAQMKEKMQNSVVITDVPYSTMKNLVEFLYTGNFRNVEGDNVIKILNLYIAADKYQVLDLKSLCAEKLISCATVDNILDILQLAVSHNDENFKTEALKFVSFCSDEIFKLDTWKTFKSREVDLAAEVENFCLKILR